MKSLKTYIGLAALAHVLCASAFGLSSFKFWNFTLPSSTSGDWTAAENYEGVEVDGTFNRLSNNSFVKLTVVNASGPNAPAEGSIRYALEIPGFSLFVPPTMETENRLINTVSSGPCPTKSWGGNFTITAWPEDGFDITQDTPTFGHFTWNPVTNNLVIDNIYKLTGFTSLATNITIAGTCTDGLITLSGTGDRSGTIQISSNAGSIYTVNTPTNGKVSFAAPDNAIPSLTFLEKNYSAYVFDHATVPAINPYRAAMTVASPSYFRLSEMTDIDANTSDSNEGYYLRSVTINTPHNGMFTARLTSVTGGSETSYGSTNDEVVCVVYLAQKTFIACLGHDNPNDDTKPLSFIMVSDDQAAATATVDSYSFGTGGKVITSMGSYYGNVNDMALQSNGKVVAVGTAYTTNYDHALVRYEADGTLDTTFGTAGKVILTTVGTANIEDKAMAVAIQGDGKIVTAGHGYNTTNYDPVLVRFTTSGALDTSFATTGKVFLSATSSSDYGLAVALQSNGKILLGGYTTFGGYTDFYLARQNSDGTVDTSFGTSGVVQTTFNRQLTDKIMNVAVQSDGKILVSGDIYSTSTYHDWGLARYTTTGALDTTFSSDGKQTIPFTSGFVFDYCKGMTLQPDGKAVLVGTTSTDTIMAVARLTTAGELDTTFSSDGKMTTTFAAGNNELNAVATQADGKIVAVGRALNGSFYDFSVIRLTTDGALDTLFSGDGRIQFSMSNPDYNDMANAVVIQNDGKIFIGGSVMESNAVYDDFGVVRLWGN